MFPLKNKIRNAGTWRKRRDDLSIEEDSQKLPREGREGEARGARRAVPDHASGCTPSLPVCAERKGFSPCIARGWAVMKFGFVPIFLPPCDQAFRRPLCPSCEDGMQHADVLRLRFELPRQTLTGHSLGRRCDAGA